MVVSSKLNKSLVDKAWEEAVAARLRAYAPYSKFLVGAALVLEDGTVIPGCNVENASYGGTICAERTALTSAQAKYGNFKATALVLVTEPSEVPCGICLQMMAELLSPSTPIYLCDTKGIKRELTMQELLPHRFSKDSLK